MAIVSRDAVRDRAERGWDVCGVLIVLSRP